MRSRKSLYLLISIVGLIVIVFLSLILGTKEIEIQEIYEAFFHFSPDNYNHIVIREMRLARTLIGLSVGMALALSGTAMQAITGNPLAGPSLIGINSGASLGIVLSVYFLGLVNPIHYMWFALVGAAASALLVFILSSAGGSKISPLKLALSGVVISTLLNSWLSAILLFNQETLDIVRFWLVGSLAGRNLDALLKVFPFMIVGILILLYCANQLNIISMGDETAKSLGMRPQRFRLLIGCAVVLASASSVAVAGPIAFVGLAIPHLVRQISGPDYRWTILYSLVLGPLFLLAADIIGRLIARPSEIFVGIITAIFGSIILIIMVRKKGLVLQ